MFTAYRRGSFHNMALTPSCFLRTYQNHLRSIWIQTTTTTIVLIDSGQLTGHKVIHPMNLKELRVVLSRPTHSSSTPAERPGGSRWTPLDEIPGVRALDNSEEGYKAKEKVTHFSYLSWARDSSQQPFRLPMLA